MQRSAEPGPRAVLVVDDDIASRTMAIEDLTSGGYRTAGAATLDDGLRLASSLEVDAILLDIALPQVAGGVTLARGGLDALPEFRARWPSAEIVILSAHDHALLGMEALRKGAADFIVKPYAPEHLLAVLDRALAASRVRRELGYLREEIGGTRGDLFATAGAAMKAVLDTIRSAAPTDATVLITGATGTGKELAARAIHAASARAAGPFVAVNLAALPSELVESTLFGHERGAFTGAICAQAGRFETARDGTLFFDEVGELAPGLQGKLLRVLQEGEFERVGGARTIRSNARIVAATNRDLGAEIAAGRFREDLFYRLNVIPLYLPPLRKRLDELPALAALFLERYARRYGRAIPGFEPAALAELRLHAWPGNVRELEHLVQRLVVLRREPGSIAVEDLPIEYRYGALLRQPAASSDGPLAGALDAFEKDFLLQALARCDGRRGDAAVLLGISEATLFRKLNRHGLYASEVTPMRPNAGKKRAE